jgi:hypothetical protein
MEKQKMRFTKRKSGGDRILIWYAYFLIYKWRQRKSGELERVIFRQNRRKIPPAEKYKNSLQLSWQRSFVGVSVSGPTCWVQMWSAEWHVLTLGCFFWFGIQIETVAELCTKKHDFSLGGDVTARLHPQTDRQTDRQSFSTNMQQHFHFLLSTEFLLD